MTDEAGGEVFRRALVAQLDAFAAMVTDGSAGQGASPADAVAALEAVEVGTTMYSNSSSPNTSRSE